MKTNSILYLTLFFVLLQFLGGCMRCYQVVLTPKDQPLVGPGQEAIEMASVCENIEVRVDHLAWRNGQGRTWNAETVTNQCEAYLKTLGKWESIYYPRGVPTTLPTQIHTAKYIICLDPIVVVGPITRDVEDSDNGSVRIHPMDPWKESPLYASLPGYFFYGTRLPFQENLQWFSPDLKVPPQSLERVSATRYRITVPWGSIFLDHRDGEFIVTASNK